MHRSMRVQVCWQLPLSQPFALFRTQAVQGRLFMRQNGLIALAAGCATIMVAMSISHHIVHGKDILRPIRPTSTLNVLAKTEEVRPAAIPPFAICRDQKWVRDCDS